jgi:hypothetical protein
VAGSVNFSQILVDQQVAGQLHFTIRPSGQAGSLPLWL